MTIGKKSVFAQCVLSIVFKLCFSNGFCSYYERNRDLIFFLILI